MKKVPVIVISLLLALVITNICTRTTFNANTTNNRIEWVEKRIEPLKTSEGENNNKKTRLSLPFQENEQIIEEEIPQDPLRNGLPIINAPLKTQEAFSFYGNGNEFVSEWNTTLTSSGSSNSTQISLPLESSGTYDFIVDWGDNSNNDTITKWNQTEINHTYATAGEYTVAINGTLSGWRFNNDGDRLKLIEISQWGNLNVGNNNSYFYGCENLVLTASDAPDLTRTTTLFQAFRGCLNLGTTGDMNNWNVSSVTDMGWMFCDASAFNQSLDTWNVSNVTDMRYMFVRASAFNQPLNSWNVSSVTNMVAMFDRASMFNQPLDAWDVSNVTIMYGMFRQASSFNQDLSAWNVSSVTNMAEMFSYASAFNQDLSAWNVSSVTNMNRMFYRASTFNQNLSAWNVSSVTNMGSMLTSVTLSTDNYDQLLLSWSQLPLQAGVTFSGGSSQYSLASVGARQYIIDTFGWMITDAGRGSSPSEFISTWDTIFTSVGSSGTNQISLPLISSGIYDFIVDWGDDNIDTITVWNQSEVTHTYSSGGVYNVIILGTITGWQFNNGSDKLKLITISQWGKLNVGNSGSYFYGCENLVLTATDIPDLTGTTTLYQAFRGCLNLGSTGDMNNWNVSSVTNMSYMFYSTSAFNQPLDAWDVSSVTNMNEMFSGASAFNQDLSTWNVYSVTNMELMFYDVTLSTDNYDQLLLAWSQLSLQTGVDFNGGSSQYSLVSASARQYIIDTFGWNILDGGLVIDSTAPELDSPSNITYEEDTTGNSIVWTAGDAYPAVYNVTLDGSLYVSDTVWINGTITVNIDGLNPGTYMFKIVVCDSKGNSAIDSVQVTVLTAITGNNTTDSVQITPGFELLTIISSLVFLLIFRQKWKRKWEK